MKQPVKIIWNWLNAIEEEGVGLTEWETLFCQSLRRQLDNHGPLSEKQQDILERIYAEKTP